MASNHKVALHYKFNISESSVLVDEPDFISFVSILHMHSNKLMYEVGNDGKSGGIDAKLIILDFNTANMTDNDPLMIVYESQESQSQIDPGLVLDDLLKEVKKVNKYLAKIYNQ